MSQRFENKRIHRKAERINLKRNNAFANLVKASEGINNQNQSQTIYTKNFIYDNACPTMKTWTLHQVANAALDIEETFCEEFARSCWSERKLSLPPNFVQYLWITSSENGNKNAIHKSSFQQMQQEIHCFFPDDNLIIQGRKGAQRIKLKTWLWRELPQDLK